MIWIGVSVGLAVIGLICYILLSKIDKGCVSESKLGELRGEKWLR